MSRDQKWRGGQPGRVGWDDPKGRRPGAGRWPARTVGSVALVTFVLLATTAGAALRTNAIDSRVARSAHTLGTHHSWIVGLARGATFLGSTTCLVAVVAGVCLLLWIRRKPQLAVAIALWSIASSLLVAVIKMLSARARPVFADPVAHVSGYAFPSGHATNSTVVYGTVLLLVLGHAVAPAVRRCSATVIVMLVAAIATSRVILGVHWASDVLAGVALGVALDALAWSTTIRRYTGAASELPVRRSRP